MPTSAWIWTTSYLSLDAGIPENGQEVDGLDDKSELAHCMMLVNLLRISGAVKNKKASRHFVTRPTQVIRLPTTVFSETMACTPSLSYLLRLSSNDGPLKVGVNTSVRLVQSLGKSSTY